MKNNKIVVWEDGSYIFTDTSTEYENDSNWLVTIPISESSAEPAPSKAELVNLEGTVLEIWNKAQQPTTASNATTEAKPDFEKFKKEEFQKISVNLRNKVTGKTYVSVFEIAEILELFWNEECKNDIDLRDYYCQQGQVLQQEVERLKEEMQIKVNYYEDKLETCQRTKDSDYNDLASKDAEMDGLIEIHQLQSKELEEQLSQKDAELKEMRESASEVMKAIYQYDKLRSDRVIKKVHKQAEEEVAKCLSKLDSILRHQAIKKNFSGSGN